MPIMIQGTGTQTKPVFMEPTLPASTIVPSKREAIEALATVQRLSAITAPDAFDTLRRFILTR